MNNSEIFFLLIIPIVLLIPIALETIRDIRASKKYKQYIDSIKIGDKFMMRWTFDEDVNPFEERRKPIIVEIIDIKTNKIGEKYVKYRGINGPPNLAGNSKINIFTELFVCCND